MGFRIRNCARREPLCQAPQTRTRVRSLLLLQSILTSGPAANVITRALDSVGTLRLLIPVDRPEHLELQTCPCYSVRRESSVEKARDMSEAEVRAWRITFCSTSNFLTWSRTQTLVAGCHSLAWCSRPQVHKPVLTSLRLFPQSRHAEPITGADQNVFSNMVLKPA